MRASQRNATLPGWVRPPRWVRLPGRTVRTRLTILYGILFVFSGALLLAIASGVAVGSSRRSAAPALPADNSAPGSPLDQANARIHQLQAQISQLQSQAAGAAGPDQALACAADLVADRAGDHDSDLGWRSAGWWPGARCSPVRQMTAAAQRISEDSLHERLAVQGPEGRAEGTRGHHRRPAGAAGDRIQRPAPVRRQRLPRTADSADHDASIAGRGAGEARSCPAADRRAGRAAAR